ncbi:MAG: glycosyltransferase [Bacilli bacterium]|nr:glycosyltransferase [Bacilli bacterium]
MKKILFIIHRFHYSGAAKAMQLIANGLAKLDKYEICIASYCDTSPCYEVDSKIKVISGTNKYGKGLKNKIGAYKSTKKIIKEYNPDIVISFLNNASFYSILSTLFDKRKVIVCERCDPFNENTRSLKFMRKFFRFAYGGVFQTEGAKKYYKNRIKNTTVIPNIVDNKYKNVKIEKFNARKNEIDIFSRIEIKQKRHDILIKAFNEIHIVHPELILNIYGDGPDEDKIKNIVNELKLNAFVNFKGSTNNALNILKDSKLTILSSDYEGIPNGVIDALAIGIPVVATDTSPGGVRLLIEDGKNGYIVPCGDYMKLANKVNFLIEHPDIADEFSKESIKINERFSEKNIIKLWDEYIDKI